ncbi:hypothetical protein AGDE_12697 [Angomonas deanei]|nr:hypothetical protein AGDE_12697 [Angomonas deanei]|eukprot:EPY23984.1 hypothetical protein AGDE_12697 [Angomonas deanei]
MPSGVVFRKNEKTEKVSNKLDAYFPDSEKLKKTFANIRESTDLLSKVLNTDDRRALFRHHLFFKKAKTCLTKLRKACKSSGEGDFSLTFKGLERNGLLPSKEKAHPSDHQSSVPAEYLTRAYAMHRAVSRLAVVESVRELASSRVNTASLQLALLSIYGKILMNLASLLYYFVLAPEEGNCPDGCEKLSRLVVSRWGEAYVAKVARYWREVLCREGKKDTLQGAVPVSARGRDNRKRSRSLGDYRSLLAVYSATEESGKGGGKRRRAKGVRND